MRPAWGVVRDANKGNDPKPAFAISCVLIAQTPLRCTAMHATTVSPLLLLTGPSLFFLMFVWTTNEVKGNAVVRHACICLACPLVISNLKRTIYAFFYVTPYFEEI